MDKSTAWQASREKVNNRSGSLLAESEESSKDFFVVKVNSSNFCICENEWPNTREKNGDSVQLIDPNTWRGIPPVASRNTSMEDTG